MTRYPEECERQWKAVQKKPEWEKQKEEEEKKEERNKRKEIE